MSAEKENVLILKEDINAQILFYEEIAKSPMSEKYEFITVESGIEALQLLMQMGSGCLLFSISNKKEFQGLASVLKRLKKDIKNNLFKVSGYNNIENKKVEKFLKEHHVTDIFEGELTTKAIEFKFNLWFRSIQAARKKHTQLSSQQIDQTSNKESGGLSNKLKTSTKAKNPIKYLAPLELHSDCWIFPKESGAKNIMNSWVIEMIGPGPAAGHWQDITKKTNSTTPVWKWMPTREDLFTFILDNGYWIFKGREPFFNWEVNLWKFSGNEPQLLFYSNDFQISKFYIENGQLHLTETSAQAQAKMQMIKESFDPKYSLDGDSLMDDMKGSVQNEKINLFYKGDLEKTEQEDLSDNIHKNSGYREEIDKPLTGKGSREQQVELQTSRQNKTQLELEKAANKQSSVAKQEDITSKAHQSSTKLDISQSNPQKKSQYSEQQQNSMMGKGSIEKRDDHLSGSGRVKEEIARQAHNRQKNSFEQRSTPNKKARGKKEGLSPTGPISEHDIDQLKEELEKDIQKATEIELEKSLKEIQKKAKEQKGHPLDKKTKRQELKKSEERQKRSSFHENNASFDSLSGILDAPVDIGLAQEEYQTKEQESRSPLGTSHQDRTTKSGQNHTDDKQGQQRSSIQSANKKEGNQHRQYNESHTDEYGDFSETDKDWEKYYRGGAAKKEKEKKDNKWGGPSGNGQGDNQYGGNYQGELDPSSANSSQQDGPLSGKLSPGQTESEKEEKKKAFDQYMSSIAPKQQAERKHYDAIGSSHINTKEIELSLTLKTQSHQGQLFDIEDPTELMDLIDNIVVVKNLSKKVYQLHCPILLHCQVYFSGKDYDFTLGGRLFEIEGDEGEILNLEIGKYDPQDLENLLILFTERQNNITNFLYAAQGRE